ncbi:helix-turn-helix domain-containing protein [Clostridium sp. JNZ X4-2]
MKTLDMIKQLCGQMDISVSELAGRIGQSPQNFGKKLKCETVSLEKLKNSRCSWYHIPTVFYFA